MNEKSLLINELHEQYEISKQWHISQRIQMWLKVIYQWRQNARTRRQLADLPAHLRQDIGLSDRQVHRESNKKFWQ